VSDPAGDPSRDRMPTSTASRAPYGPGTPHIRQFLVQLAGLGAESRREVLARYAMTVDTLEYAAAETLLGETIERAGRTDARDALAGPLLQLVRSGSATNEPEDVLSSLDPIAEPALAALLALLVADLVPPSTVALLYAPFETVIPRRPGD